MATGLHLTAAAGVPVSACWPQGECTRGISARAMLQCLQCCIAFKRSQEEGQQCPSRMIAAPGDCSALHAWYAALVLYIRLVRRGGRGGSARGAARGVPMHNPPFHSLQHGGQRGDDTAAGTDGGDVLLHRCSKVSFFPCPFPHCFLSAFRITFDSWGEEGEGAARGGQQEASLCIIPPFHSLQHGGQRGDDTAAGTDGGDVLLHRCSKVSFFPCPRLVRRGGRGGSARGAARGVPMHNPPFHSLQHGGQRGEDTAAGTDGGSKTEDRPRLRHRCCAAGVADGVGSDAARA
ncbi:unnamed protein product [Closterium sp. Naga37s-1]|nr:unnamed protein product [Closterium sp. Naga37s-1]